MKSPLFLALAASAFSVSAAFAEPPENALPLSEIIQTVESTGEIAYVTEVEWNEDQAAWTIAYVDAEGAEGSISLDAVTGQPNS
ncbi:hypothetical protein [Neomegalonema perideroedes]|uniref:hypothetical protein n=1 Tax=Neomegalonema perideroedes TaxID=217219 RepID=UPI00037225A1|nr:hypothetical protein [Neomegalonema perideroedes]